MMYIGNVLSLGSYTYSSIGTDQQSINAEQRGRIVIDIRTSADFEGGWLYLYQFDPANLAHILKHISPFLANAATDNSSFRSYSVPGIFSHIFVATAKEEPGG